MADRLAVVTGASTGLGYQLARLAAQDGHDLIICADEDEIHTAADKLRSLGAQVEATVVDLSSKAGVDTFWAAVDGRPVDLFCANAGRALGQAFADQDWPDVKRLIDLNILQTTTVLHRIGRQMHARGQGRILVTGSIVGYVPGPYDAVYDATKAYLNSLCYALQDEWEGSPVTLTCLMPGPTETPIFHREGNDLEDAPIAEQDKDDPVKVAERGYAAAMEGQRGVVPGLHNRAITALTGLVPETILARIHRMAAEPQ
ncbi:SDR family NAD(P)-dependent oxidoreductase [Roseicyclus sp. F158]|uniref:SDR family NAD(P)-dependent oxidoreductase n=1 Tax=Tropicimonas omnivorans TaxID=3075590 RepID=A0ABU3DKA6_9RHOB|nr:SDR family NAD(P)-dependent oxidoreductase [Roseicyclus sp. F158]MDT0684151.1 SDR family NAD(P)-dependent oxidoreductase [Roseicyclus sp. F158]